MKQQYVEVVSDQGNHGKFLLLQPAEEDWAERQHVSATIPQTEFGPLSVSLYGARGWTREHVWVLDLQTGEGLCVCPHPHWDGAAAYDLDQKHRVWVCPLCQPFLEWLYPRWQDEFACNVQAVPRIVKLEGVPLQLRGYRREGSALPGVEDITGAGR